MTRQELLEAIAEQISDYRAGELAKPDAAHVDRWVRQFDGEVQVPLLREVHHIFGKVYATKADVMAFLTNLATNEKLTGRDPTLFWRGAGLLDIQRSGESQSDMLDLFDGVLESELGLSRDDCRGDSGVFVYLDDAIFSGTKVRYDIEPWLAEAPRDITLHVVTMALHRGGEWYAGERIRARAKELGKKITVSFWRGITLEDRVKYLHESDVLKPRSLPDDPEVAAYARGIEDPKHPIVLRTGNQVGDLGLFTSPKGRELVEQEFLKAGVRIRRICPALKPTMRPLGYHYFPTLGFGALVVTHRNCPNNCPLAFWASRPWYPLLARKTNT